MIPLRALSELIACAAFEFIKKPNSQGWSSFFWQWSIDFPPQPSWNRCQANWYDCEVLRTARDHCHSESCQPVTGKYLPDGLYGNAFLDQPRLWSNCASPKSTNNLTKNLKQHELCPKRPTIYYLFTESVLRHSWMWSGVHLGPKSQQEFQKS